MLTCKQVSRVLQNENYEDLSPLRKFLLKLHIKLCVVCGKYNSQIIESQQMCRCYKQHEERNSLPQVFLDPKQKEALSKALAEQTKGSTSSGT